MSLTITPDKHLRLLAILDPRHPASDSWPGRHIYFRSHNRSRRDRDSTRKPSVHVHVKVGGHGFGSGYGGINPMTSSSRILESIHREPSRPQPPKAALLNTSIIRKALLTSLELIAASAEDW